MIKNYLKIAWRNLVKQRLYSVITISGLAVGLAVCITILLYVAHERSYDSFHKNADRIFTSHNITQMGENRMDFQLYNAGEDIKKTQPKVDDYIGVHNHKKVIVSLPSSPAAKFEEDNLIFTGDNFFSFFSFRLLSGNAATALKDPFSVVLSKDMAKKYFGQDNPVGKTIAIRTNSSHTYHVTGVAENNPSNSSISFNFIASGSTLLKLEEYGNYRINGTTYLRLKHAADSSTVARSVQSTYKKDEKAKFALAPLIDTHLKGVFGAGATGGFLKIFPLVAALILLLALVNYMSLATAKATLRAKEVGVRKVAGASRKTIAIQFFVESALFTLLSFALAYVLFYLFKPWFLNVLQLKIDDSFLFNPKVLTLLLILLVGTIITAGSYPALVLSAFKPASTLKGKTGKSNGGVVVRKVFTTLQFTIAVALIICGITIDRQLYFFRHADTGLNRENVLIVPGRASFGENYRAFNQDVKALVGNDMVATSQRNVYDPGFNMLMLDDMVSKETNFVNYMEVDSQFMRLLNLKWKHKPATFNKADNNELFINEEAINKLHLDPNPVGTVIGTKGMSYTVGGVLKNFNSLSLATNIQPMAVAVKPDTASSWNAFGFNLYIKIKPHTNIPTFINSIKKLYDKYDAETPFNYSFLDDDFNAQYKTEDRLASIFSLFTCIAIILATLGLFGLAAFTIEQRVKEIGIRKVLGASITSINTLLSIDFLKLVVLSVIIASPIAWWAMHNWLQKFAYRIAVPWWVFIMAAAIAVITSLLTVSYNAVRAALANPVKSLRSE
ncbi:ABC transporter permease [Mucilaginibacter calamicampi]|uniref:ABC transporter permease n=1 Tax=Mucilaginibacter calamicampi TaxID=1302352 RepID=A0ABW2YWX9_9SPHI